MGFSDQFRALPKALISLEGIGFALLLFVQSPLSKGQPVTYYDILLLFIIVLLGVGIACLWKRPSEQTPDVDGTDSADQAVRKKAIEDVFLACATALGPTYRLNLMRLKPGPQVPEQTFGFVAQYKYTIKEIRDYDGKIKVSTPGVGTAFLQQQTVHLGEAEMDRTVDDYANQVWSAPIRGTRSVLNIDTSLKDKKITSVQIERVRNVAQTLADDIVANHQPESLPFLIS